ncbi:C-type lectin domain family 2 member D-like isoform X2 [Cygnus olor]|uniref:C-type lectin domain family 2 member D-like isoform X2 n=1 Tax=Cygnus olor TaxID=8869 RepID=UPI001ADE2549|nr:C-type lectin domain family 2 member D-like isoform X2 [Cygnus olor]XP_040398804.1 C-type lectin domain family 2 member D-like isoform X2 [Cygnus olor]XP_040398805.1 C-type lectin domain family 2 member D-like isoform X2 [Cygnus olor]
MTRVDSPPATRTRTSPRTPRTWWCPSTQRCRRMLRPRAATGPEDAQVSKVCTARGQCVLAGTVILMLIFAIAGLSAVHRQKAAPVLACPYEWVGYRNVCYYLSGQQKLGSWNWSQEQCTTHGASLAMVMRDWELNFLRQLKDSADSWLGLRRRGERLLWVDGSSFKETFTVQGGAECVYLNGEDVATSSCWQSRPYICSKALAVGAAPENGGGETTFPVLDTGGSSH